MILGERLLADAKTQLESTLSDANFSPSILETEPLERIAEKLFPNNVGKKAGSLRQRFDKGAKRYALAQRALASQPSEHICREISFEAPTFRDALLKEIFSFRLAGYYFLQQIEVNGDDKGYIVLLREIQLLPKLLAEEVAKGLSKSRFIEVCTSDKSFEGRLDLDSLQLALPIGELDSPNIEHLMQTFSMLFGRIGIRDLNPSYIKNFWPVQPTLEKKL